MFGIFQKKKTCSLCGATSDTTKIVNFDPTNRGEFKEAGTKESLCIDCLNKKWAEALKNYQGVSVCFFPVKGLNSYSYITLERAKEWSLEERDINLLNDIINRHSGEKCKKCSTNGNFLLFNFPYYNYETNEVILRTKTNEIPEALCGECFVQRIIKEIELQNLSIDEINTPFGKKGVYMAGEY